MKKWLLRKTERYLEKVIEIKHSPKAIAAGFAIGTFIGILPTPGLNILIGLLVVFLLPRISKIALFAAIILWNPIVSAPSYWLSYKIGAYLFAGAPVVKYNIEILNWAYEFSRRFLVGNVIVATTFSVISYFFVKWVATEYKKHKEHKIAE